MKNKLSTTQKKVLNQAIQEITQARSCSTYEEYFNSHLLSETNIIFSSLDNFKSMDPTGYKISLNQWENLKQGIATTYCNTKTILKLETLGYIEILENANGVHWGNDTIRVLGI